jgi:hypothetical protein
LTLAIRTDKVITRSPSTHEERATMRFRRLIPRVIVPVCCALAACSGSEPPSAAPDPDETGLPYPYSLADAQPVPKAVCGPGSMPEPGMQGRIPAEDYASGRAALGYTCNTEMLCSYTVPNADGGLGGFNVWRYVDKTGKECAFYDTSNVVPINLSGGNAGVNVLDMSDPSQPVLSTTLQTPAMMSPHESLILNTQRGLLMAVLGNAVTYPGLVDIYDVSENCLEPVLKSSSLVGLLGHESGISPDGLTFYTGSPLVPTMAAIDVSDPGKPALLTFNAAIRAHGISVSDDGNTAYVAVISTGGTTLPVGPPTNGVAIMDVSEVQARKPVPMMREISHLFWEGMGAPQFAAPFSVGSKSFLLAVDEFGFSAVDNIPAARIIDVTDPANPRIVSDVRLEVHQRENFSTFGNDPSAAVPFPGYSAHYCNVPRRVDPKIAACPMGLSGLRVFNIENPYRPREVAYFIQPFEGRNQGDTSEPVSKPAFVPERREIWYSDNRGFYVVRLTGNAWPQD